ncbi:hypothetical protein IWX83_003496 [Flavobacterium sp. CG_9.1]|nr:MULTISPECIES: hypothetical protein [Flavobacterium]MBG6063680.1 hypothetical protein [Flavobacterium sp. CG_9.1]
MKAEKKQKENKSKFNLEKMKVAQLDNLHLINGGDSAIIANGGDDKTITQSNKTMTITF